MKVPVFGVVLHGRLNDFAFGEPHMMAVSGVEWRSRWCFRLAPISKKRFNEGQAGVLWLPATLTLDTGRTFLKWGSFMILYWKRCYDTNDVERLERLGSLPAGVQREMREILEQLHA